jgi:hypothetical protein
MHEGDVAWWRDIYEPEDWRVFEDFRVFLFVVWQFLGLPPPTPLQYDIATYLQHGPRRSIIEAYRGVGKSWVTSAYVCWRLLRNPQLKMLVVSASKDRADQFSTFTLRLINELPILAHLVPKADQRSSMIAFDVGPARPDHSPSVKSVGIFGQLTGSRADEIIADDIEVPNNAETQGQRDKLSERVKEFDAIIKPGGKIKYLGTPQTEESLYNKLPERGYTIRIWPARYPKPKDVLGIYGDSLASVIAGPLAKDPGIAGKPTDPVRFDNDDLMERELSYGRSGFALQFMLDTRLSDADRYPLKLGDLVVTSINDDVAPEKVIWAASPEYVIQGLECVGFSGDRYYRPAASLGDWVPFTGSVMFIDPSGRGKDETAYAVSKMLNSYIYVPEWRGLAGGYTEAVMIAIAEAAKRNKVNLIKVESNFGDGMFVQLLMPHLRKIHPCQVEEVRASRQKELRIIETLEPVMNAHKLIIDPRVIEHDRRSTAHLPPEIAIRYQGLYQMSRITKERGALSHDDRLDALAGSVDHWKSVIAMDADERMKSRQEEQLQEALDMAMGVIDISPDGYGLGLSRDQALKVQTKGQGKHLDMLEY